MLKISGGFEGGEKDKKPEDGRATLICWYLSYKYKYFLVFMKLSLYLSMEKPRYPNPFLGNINSTLNKHINETNSFVTHSLMTPDHLEWLCNEAKPITKSLYFYIMYKLLPIEKSYFKFDMEEAVSYLKVSKETIYTGLNELWAVTLITKANRPYWFVNPVQMFVGDRSKACDLGYMPTEDK